MSRFCTCSGRPGCSSPIHSRSCLTWISTALPAFLVSKSGHSLLRTNAASCMMPTLSGLAIFFSVGMSARGTSYRPTLSWAASSTTPSTVSSSLSRRATPRPFGSKSGCVGSDGQQLTAATVECRSHSLAALDAGVQIAGEGEHLLGRARAEVVIGGADDAVGAAERIAERRGERAAAAVELGPGVVPVVRGQVGGGLGEAVVFEQVVDDDKGGQVRLAVFGKEVRQPDDGVAFAELPLSSCTRRTSSAGKRSPSSKG